LQPQSYEIFVGSEQEKTHTTKILWGPDLRAPTGSAPMPIDDVCILFTRSDFARTTD